ncbi:hypothetical protein [Vibrio crassostreae]|uniref:hypothetical protein n=1 Tax=Vibrio crassostreae TaxID=246167 RepID=UPI0010521016|nr:hypothetical protein [Vibrio crassostreae]TCW20799.1 hypothetical protein EDB48_103140 [Vibrio crassostreae]
MRLYAAYKKMDNKEFGMTIIEELQEKFDVDLKTILFDENKSSEEVRIEACQALYDAVYAHHEREGNTDWTEHGEGSNNPGKFEAEPNFFMSAQNAKDYSELRGQDIIDQLKIVNKRLSNMLESPNYGMAAFELWAGGFVGITVLGGLTFAGYAIAGATELAAIAASLKSMKGSAIVTVVVCVIMMVIFFVFMRPAKALALVVNRTQQNLIVHDYAKDNGGLYMNTGKMSVFMKDHAEIGAVKPDWVQIHGMLNVGLPSFKSGVFAGWYFAEKRSMEPYGTDGAMIFAAQDNSFKFAHEFAVPLHGEKGTNIKLLPGDNEQSAKNIFKGLREEQDQQKAFTEGSYTLTSAVSTKSDQEVGIIVTFTDDMDPLNKNLN